MQDAALERFVGAFLRFRKVDVCVLTGGNIHFGELAVMEDVARKGCTADLNVPGLCSRLHVSRPAISQMLGSLEKKGCITRQVCVDDRRRISVTVTPKGQAYLNESQRCYSHSMEALVQRFGADNLETLVHLLDELADVYDQIKKENTNGGNPL